MEDAGVGNGVSFVASPRRVGEDLKNRGRVAGQGTVRYVCPGVAASLGGNINIAAASSHIEERIRGAERIAWQRRSVGQGLCESGTESSCGRDKRPEVPLVDGGINLTGRRTDEKLLIIN